MAFSREFFCGVYAEFGPDGDLGCGVVEDVSRAFGEYAVTLRVGASAEVEEH